MRQSVTISLMVMVVCCIGAGAVTASEDFYLPLSFYVPGTGGSLFVHEIELFNPGADPATVRIDWLPRGEDNTVPPASETVVVPGLTAVRYDNVLLDLLGLSPGAIGAIRVVSVEGRVAVDSWGLNLLAGAAFGHVIPTIPESEAVPQGEPAFLMHLSETGDRRSSVWCQNLTTAGITVDLDLYDLSGLFLEPHTMALEPLSNGFINRIFRDFNPVEGFVEVSTATPGGAFTCCALVLDNATNDPRLQPLTLLDDLAALQFYMPYAVNTTTGNADVALLAPVGDTRVRIRLLRTGEDNVAVNDFVEFVMSSGTATLVDHVLGDYFQHEGTAALDIGATSGWIAVSGQVTTAVPGGLMTRHSTVRPGDDAALAGDEAVLIHLSESGLRWSDFGVVNTSRSSITLIIELSDSGGSLLDRQWLNVLPLGHEQLDSVFAAAGFPDVPDGVIRVRSTTPGGSFIAYAAVTDVLTEDSFEVPALVVRTAIFADGFETGSTSAWSTQR